jgi:DNA helicase IV
LSERSEAERQRGDQIFPDLPREQAHLAQSRASRLRMIDDLKRTRATDSAADDVTQEYIEMMADFALQSLADPSSAEFFGRIDSEDDETFHIGRRHIEDGKRNPVVVDWRAGIAAPFYRATVSDSYGLRRRRRFTNRDGDIVAYNDERLDDPTAADIAGGIPDPVLAEIGAARTGAMREIVATIQAEQDIIIRSPIESCVIVQGGPGTGKTAVGLHRVAFLLFDQRARLAREGVLVVGPNRVFLDYIGNVLPSLGERSVDQRTLADLLMPRVEIDATDTDDIAKLKGDVRLAQVIERLSVSRIQPPAEPVRVPVSVRTVVVTPDELAEWAADALRGNTPLNQRRIGFRTLVEQSVGRRAGKEVKLGKQPALRAAVDKMWPSIAPLPIVRSLRRAEDLGPAADGLLDAEEQALLTKRSKGFSIADAVLIDEANSLLNGPPRVYGHIVVDEAQDLSALAFRAIGRRVPSRSLTVLGDLAQSTSPAGQNSWRDVLAVLGQPTQASVEHLTIGYRVPAAILANANLLLADADVSVPASRSVREEGHPPFIVPSDEATSPTAAVQAVIDLRHRHRLSGIICPGVMTEAVEAALRDANLVPVSHLHGLGDNDVPLIPAETAKGLELDGVVVLEPSFIHDGTPRGARLLYIAMTRAVQELVMVTSRPLPGALAQAGTNL